MALPKRPLGKTGVEVPVIGFGTAPLGKGKIMDALMLNKSARLLNYAIDQGVTYFDTSPDYGSQLKIGEVMKKRRSEVFLATKANKRKRIDVLVELKQSLAELQTDHVDLVQIHGINTMADLEVALAPDGAIAALEEARHEGMTRFVGITGHTRPGLLAHALERINFDTVQCAFGIIDELVNGPQALLLPVAKNKQIGVIATKVYGRGQLKQHKLALRYSLNIPGVSIAVISMENEAQLDENVRLAQILDPLTETDSRSLVTEARNLIENDTPSDRSPISWIYDTKTKIWTEDSERAAAAN